MSIITLTTDLGDKDPYTAALKGAILRHHPEARLIDVSHNISRFNVLEAAFALQTVYPHFPPGSVHLIGVDPEQGGRRPGIIMEFDGHYFVAPDNGVLSLIRREGTAEVLGITAESLGLPGSSRSFRALGLFAPAAARISRGDSFRSLGEPIQMLEYFWGEPTYSENSLRGIIVHIDHFGNAITNIRKREFLRIKGDRSFQVFIRSLRLQRIVSTYSDVSKGEALAVFGESGHLEIAIREGSAEQLLGLSNQDMLTIEFYG